MLPDSVAAYDPWLLPLVLVGVPVLAGLSWLLWASALGARFHDHPPRHPRSRVALVIGMGAILLSTSAAMVWYPRPGGTLIALFGSVVLMVCFLYLSGVSRPLRLTTNEPYRLDGTVIGLGGMISCCGRARFISPFTCRTSTRFARKTRSNVALA